MEIRFDRGVLQRPQKRGRSLVVEGHAAREHRPGDPLRYAHGDEFRDASELRRIVDKLPGTPVTMGHPSGLIRDGAKAHVVGRVDAAWVDGEHAAVRMTLDGVDGLDAKELSLGYACGIRADRFQSDTEIDHLAIVEKARCGATCSLRTDARLDCTCSQIDRLNEPHEIEGSKGEPMANEKTDKQRADELETSVSTLQAEVKRLEAMLASGAQAAESEKLKAAEKRADEAEAKVKRFDETLEQRAGELASLRAEASRHLGATVRLDGMTPRQIHEVVIKRLDASVDVSSENDDQVRGRFNTLTALAARNIESQERVSEILGRASSVARADEKPSYEDVENARWKQTLKNGRDAAKEGR